MHVHRDVKYIARKAMKIKKTENKVIQKILMKFCGLS